MSNFSDAFVKSAYHFLRPYEYKYHFQCKTPKQLKLRPTCNVLHELTDYSLLSMRGSWRSAWVLQQQPVVLKMLQLRRDFDKESYGYHQIDSMAMERLSSSRHVVDEYGFCGQSVLVEYEPREGRAAIKDTNLNPRDRVKLARDLSKGLADIHQKGFIHNDINVANLVGNIKYNDFNIANMVKWDGENECGFPVRFVGPLWRSPEEILNKTYVDNKIDIYALANVLYQVMTKHQPWTWLEPGGKKELEQVAKLKIEGHQPFFPEKFADSGKISMMALYHATVAAYRADPKTRPSASDLTRGFDQVLQWIDKREKTTTNREVQALFDPQP
mmetsp:Transcript_19736/g.28529  ORF Transcript_19736/g.28529 Transcript_19736/m.28529 type:complete len:329 (+) Transcript_19736:29-1015(+)